MKNRLMFQGPRTRRGQGTPGGHVRAEDATAELAEAWRSWEAANTSLFFNWFIFTPDESIKTARPVLQEDWVYFQGRSWKLDGSARAMLAHLVPLLEADPEIQIVIGGIASQPGTVADEMRLALRRVQSIRRCLFAHGVDPDRVGIAIRGRKWFLTDRSGASGNPDDRHDEYRLQVTDPHWSLVRN